MERCGLPSTVERTMVGFMGCYAAINALKLARHIVRSEPKARVLALNLELCTLHLHETDDLEEMLPSCCLPMAAPRRLVSADPVGVEIKSFAPPGALHQRADPLAYPASRASTWCCRAGAGAIRTALTEARDGHIGGANDIEIVGGASGRAHGPGCGGTGLWPAAGGIGRLRSVLNDYGNMSSGTVMFVLDRIMRTAPKCRKNGCAMSFGPGLVAETMMFRMARDVPCGRADAGDSGFLAPDDPRAHALRRDLARINAVMRQSAIMARLLAISRAQIAGRSGRRRWPFHARRGETAGKRWRV
jgi:hypothetical protein